MSTKMQGNAAWYRAKAEEARKEGDAKQLSLALSDLGAILLESREFTQGMDAFEEAATLAADSGDRHFHAQCLARKAAALDEIGRYHNAFEAMTEILELAKVHKDLGMQCDALIDQGQILIRSGEPVLAEETLKQALRVSDALNSKSHLMRLLGTMGNLKVALAALDEAAVFFDQAVALAKQTHAHQAQCGYLLNKGAVLVWQKRFDTALRVFHDALALSGEIDDPQVALTSLRYLTECYHQIDAFDKVPVLAWRGIELAVANHKHDLVSKFFQTLILAYYRLDQSEDARQAIQEAILYAKSARDFDAEANMLINLGEACVVAGDYAQAFEAYTVARGLISRLERPDDEAYVVGRLGVVLAELGQLNEAVTHHQEAAELARQRNIPDLRGEQLTMLALAAMDQQKTEQAQSYCQEAIRVFSSAQLAEQEANARQLLAEITSQ